MNQNDAHKPESREKDDEALITAMEIELIQKRASWQKAHAQRRGWRAASFIFLFIVVIGVLFALYYVRTMMPPKTLDQPRTAPSASPER